jgi:hypothetical protein
VDDEAPTQLFEGKPLHILRLFVIKTEYNKSYERENEKKMKEDTIQKTMSTPTEVKYTGTFSKLRRHPTLHMPDVYEYYHLLTALKV